MKHIKAFCITALCLLFANVSISHAAFTVYTDYASWAAAVGESTVETFDSATVEYWSDPFSQTFTNFTIQGNTQGDNIGIVDGAGAANIDGTPYMGWNGTATGPDFTVNFSFGTCTAFGFDWNDTDGSDSYKVTVDGTSWTEPPFSSSTGTGFWGVVSDTPFSSIQFEQTAAGGVVSPFGLDNFRNNAQATEAAPSSPTVLNHILYRNTNSGAFAFVKLSNNGTLENTTRNEGIGLISNWDQLSGFSYQGASQNGDSTTNIIIANADGSRYGYLKLNANGTIKNLTNNNGVAWIHSRDMDMSSWRMVGVQDNGSHSEGLHHAIFQNNVNGDLGFMKLNGNGTIKNETGNDGFARINLGLDLGGPNTWQAFGIQENADGAGFDHILLRNTGSGQTAFIKLNANGTIKNTTRNDGFGLLYPSTIPGYYPVGIDTLSSGLLYKNPSAGTRAYAYVKLNANGTIENLTRGSGWDFLQGSYDLSGFDIFGFSTINSENAMLIRSPSQGRIAWMKLNANGTAKNTTGNDGIAWVSPDYAPVGWRAEGMDPTTY